MEENRSEGNDGILKTTGVFMVEVFKIALIAAVIVIGIRYFVIQPFFVKGASMEPSFKDGEYLIVDELSYRLKDPARGDVIVFKYPRDPKQFYIKRIIGLPGEKVEIKDGEVIIHNQENPNGLSLNEEYTRIPDSTVGNRSWQLKNDEFFVMGDNRLASSDSRSWGPLQDKFIVGRVFIRAFPFDRAKVFSPQANLPRVDKTVAVESYQ